MRLQAALALALLFSFPTGAGANDPVTGAGAKTADSVIEDDLMVRYGAGISVIGDALAKDKNKYRNPAEMVKLVDGSFTAEDRLDPDFEKFQKAFVNQMLSQLGPPPRPV